MDTFGAMIVVQARLQCGNDGYCKWITLQQLSTVIVIATFVNHLATSSTHSFGVLVCLLVSLEVVLHIHLFVGHFIGLSRELVASS